MDHYRNPLLPIIGQHLWGVSVEDFGAKATIESFDIFVLHGTAGLDEVEFDVMGVTPCLESMGSVLAW